MMSAWSKYGKRQKNKFLRDLEQVDRNTREENLERAERERKEYDDWVGDDLFDDITGWEDYDDYKYCERDEEYYGRYDYDWEDDYESMFRAGDHVRSNGGTYLVLEDGRYANLSTGAVRFTVYGAELIWRR